MSLKKYFKAFKNMLTCNNVEQPPSEIPNPPILHTRLYQLFYAGYNSQPKRF